MIVSPGSKPLKDTLTFYLIRFFKEEAYAEDFLDGRVRMMPLPYYRELEEKDGRGDPNEGSWLWLQTEGLRIHLEIPFLGRHDILGEELARPLSATFADYDRLHISCLYAVYLQGVTPVPGKQFDFAVTDRVDLESQLVIHQACLEFGAYAVLIPVKPFIGCLRQAGKIQGWKGQAGLVEYYDETKFSGHFKPQDAPFRKQSKFAYQREFRIALESTGLAVAERWINIGSLRPFAVKAPSEKLVGAFRLNQTV